MQSKVVRICVKPWSNRQKCQYEAPVQPSKTSTWSADPRSHTVLWVPHTQIQS